MVKEYKAIEVKPTGSNTPKSIIEQELEDITNTPPQNELEHQQEETEDQIDNNESPDSDDGDLEFDLDTNKPVEKQKPSDKPKQQEAEEDKPKPETKKPKNEPKKESRAQKRIKQLHSEKTEAEKRAEAAEQRAKELEKQLRTGSKTFKESEKVSLEKSLDSLSKQLTQAIQDGESEEIVRLQDEMVNTRIQLVGLQAELSQIDENNAQQEELEKQKPQQKQQQQQEVSEKIWDWIDEYPQFHPEKPEFDPVFHTAARTVSEMLVMEGYKDSEDDFYEELNNRLKNRFPEVFGIDDKNSVQYNNNTSEEDEETDEKDSSTPSKEVEIKEQTMSGSSRVPPNQGKPKRDRNSVVLSPEMVKQAERWGLTLEQMARRVAHNEKNRSRDGYVPILMGDKK